MDEPTALGLVAGTLTTLAYFPQVLKTWRSRSADGMSWSMLVTLCMGILLWLVYGLYAQDAPVILANLFTLLFSSAILGMKIRYEAVPKLQLQSSRKLASVSAALGNNVASDLALESELTFIPPEPEQSSPVA
jgi:MtN3 and saliva related transmembrane protein